AVARVDGPRVVGGGEIEDAVDHERGSFDGDGSGGRSTTSRAPTAGRRCFASCKARHPEGREILDIGRVDLFERTEAAGGVIAVVSGPGVDWLLQESGAIQSL